MNAKRTASKIALFTLTFLVLIIMFLSNQQTVTVSANSSESSDNEEASYLGASGFLIPIPIDWDAVKREIASTLQTSGTTNLNLITGEGFEIPGDVLNSIAKRNITLAMHTGSGLAFSISGSDVRTGSSSFSLNLTASGIPEAVKLPVMESASRLYEFSMAEKNGYPFYINAHMDFGQENAGKLAMLYYYNETDNSLKLAGTFQVTESGQAMFRLNRGDDYIAVVAEQVKGYVVKYGDTLSHIAVRNGVSINALRAANPQIADVDTIREGQVINIPAK